MKSFFVAAKRSGRVTLLSLFTVVFLLGGKPFVSAQAAPVSAPEQEIVQAPSFAPIASVALNVPANVVIGENFTFTATFANTSPIPSDVGYGPFIDLIFPVTGMDGAGAAADDGIDFVGATYLGTAVTAVQITFGTANTGGCSGGLGPVIHPYAVAPVTGESLIVCGTPGDKLVVLQLPFGSFVPGQPPAAIEINASLSDLADVGNALTIRARGGYQYGATPLIDWCCGIHDATILSHPSPNSGTWPGEPVTPRLFTVTKAYNGPEDETATGPNFPRQYTVTVDIADGQTLVSLDVSDILPDNMQFVALVSSSPASTPVSTPSTSTPGGTLTRHFASVTGGPGTADATMTFSFYIPRLDSSSGDVIDPVTGAPATSENEAQATADWTPIDLRDAAAPVTGICGTPCHTLTDRSIATQKSVAIVNDTPPTGYSSGDTLEYTLDFQVSDFFAFDDVTLTDVLSDGQHLDLTFPPTLAINGNGYTLAASAMGGANYTEIRHWTGGPAVLPVDGTTELVFRVSDELVARGYAGRLVGGCIDPVNGSNPPDCTHDDGPTTGTILFRAVIQQNFTDDYPSGDPSVDHGDVLEDVLTVSGSVLDPRTSAFTPTGSVPTDGSATSFIIAFGVLTKSIYAINNVIPAPTGSGMNPGDTVTFRLRYTQPASNFEETVITDYLPLPIFDAAEVTSFDSGTICGVPAAGHACLGPADSFHSLTTPVPPTPTLSTDPVGNTVSFAYVDYDSTLDVESEIDLLFTVTVTNAPFADGLFLTNQAHAMEGTTNSMPTIQDAIVQIRLNEPALYTTKSAVSTDNPNGVFTPSISAPISFHAPGTVGLPWSGGTLNSTYLDAHPIDANLGFVDAGDLVRFAIVVHNEGQSAKGAFDISIRDTLQPGYVIPGGPGLNLQVYRGDGTALTYTNVGGGAGIFDQGIKIDDPGAPGVGACQAHDATNGRNVMVVTYDLQLDNAITLDQSIINTATLFNYAATSGGPDFTNPLDLSDTAIVQPVTTPTKSISLTSEAHTSESGTGTTGDPRLVAIGEIIRFRIVQNIPEGTVANFRLHDALPAGLIFLNDDTTRIVFVSTGGAVTTTTLAGAGLNTVGNESTVPAITPGFTLPDSAVSEVDSTSAANYAADNVDDYVSGDDIFFKFGAVNNPDRDSDSEYIIVEFNALVANISGNQAGVNRDNRVAPRYGSSSEDGAFSDAVRVRVVEPAITFGKTIVSLPTPLDAGGVVQYRLSFANGNGGNASEAFDIRLTDTLPAQLQLDLASISVTLAGGAAGMTDASAGNSLDISIASVPRGGSVTIDYSATILDTVTAGEVITNTSTSTWTSLSGNGTSPNATGSVTPGASGSTTGERDGSGGVVNDYLASGAASFQILSDPLFSKSIDYTDVLDTPDPDTVIGEIVTFGLLVTLPEGTTPSLRLVDDLPDGMAYIDGSHVLVTTSPPAACGSLPEDFGGTVPAPALTVTPPAGGDSAILTFDFGAITTTGDNNADNNSFLVCFQAVVENLAGNQNGTVLTNSGSGQIAGGGIVTEDEVVHVVEPLLRIDKQVNELFPIPGQVLDFTLMIDHAAVSTAGAYDVIVFDDLPANLTLDLASVSTIPAIGTGGITNHSAGNRVEVWASALATGASLRITFQATYTGSLGDSISNTGNVTWTSKPGADANERLSGGGVNDYAASDHVGLANTRELAKSLIATNHANTTLPDVAIGELLTYQVVLTIPADSTDTAIVTDTLDSGLAFVSCSQITAGPGVTSSTVDFLAVDNCHPGTTLADNPQVSDSGRIVRFDFGTVRNANLLNTETITITYQVAVLDVVANTGGVQLDNDVEWRWTTTSLRAAAPQVTIRESDLSLEKTVDPQVALPGATVTYTLLAQHTGQSAADAFDLLLTDVLPDELVFPGGTPTVTTASGQAPDVVDYDPLTRTLTVRWNNFLLGARSELRVPAQLSSGVGRGVSISNDAALEWSSLPGDISAPQSIFNAASTERRYDPLNPADIYIVDSSAMLRTPTLPRTGFAPGRVTLLPEQPADFSYSALGDLWLEIPRLGIKVNIVGVPFKSKDWNLTWLGSQAGYLAGTAYPTHAGNTGLTAHAYLADGSPGPFVDLGKLSYGDQVIVHMSGQRYIYEVRENRLVRPNDLSVLKHEEYPWLTLLTCKGYSDSADAYQYRVAVRAVLVKVENE
ncbi:MAG: isopeptide-forming domain-containing fimbrial protein [Anaerolineales bacterium]|nr:isopeptide-forming domain-containing fimbrial protein [Anaerolineales bacterium]